MYSFLPGNVKQNPALALSSVDLSDSFASLSSSSVSVTKNSVSTVYTFLH